MTVPASGSTLNDVIPEFITASKNGKRSTILNQYPSILGGAPAETFILEYDAGVKEILTIAIKNDTAYAVIEGVKDASFDRYSSVFNSITQSFRFLK